jgi:H+/Cl- antiporter ClcA
MKKPLAALSILFVCMGLIILHFLLLHLLANARLLEHLLAPGSHSYWALAATVTFLLFRILLYVVGPGWFICRLWLRYTKPKLRGETIS